jgi:cephalosporin-C deacetylase-like acetyl esterase
MKFLKKLFIWIKNHKNKALCLFCLGSFLLLILAVLTAWCIKIFMDNRIFSDYNAAKTTDIRIINSKVEESYVTSTLVFKSQCTGHDVSVISIVPKTEGKKPVVFFLYGLLMKAEFIKKYAKEFADADLAVFVMDNYDCGMRQGEMNFTGLSILKKTFKISPKKEQIFREWIGFRYRNACAVTELRQLIDVVKRQPALDPDNIYAWGISLGVIVACNTGALSPDIKKFIFTIGSADFQQFAAKTPIRQWFPFYTRPFLPALAAEILSPLDPVNSIGKLSPRPILFQDSINDDLVPRECTEKMYKCAGLPKSRIWYKMGHMKTDKKEIHRALKEGISWLKTE